MRKNGFTLLEVLGVIVLLGVIAVLVVTLSNRILKQSKQSLYETQTETIISSAKKWTIANNDELPMSSSEGAYKLSFDKLDEDGYIDNAELIDPRNNKEICGYVQITYDDSKKQYKYKIIEEKCPEDTTE